MRILRVLVVLASVLFVLSWRSPESLLLGPAFAALHQDDLPGLDRALARGLDVNTRKADMTLLMVAASRGRADAVRLLLDRGARVELTSTTGTSALNFASLTGDAETVALLLRAGADPNAVDHRNDTPLMLAVASGDPAKVHTLLEAGADVTRTNAGGLDAVQIATDLGRADVVPLLTDAQRPHRAAAAKPTAP
jgi:ankyrin repeat protein